MVATGSAPDPFTFKEWVPDPGWTQSGYNITTGLTGIADKVRQSSIIAAPSTTKIIITGGQSNMSTSCGNSTYSVTNGAAVGNFNIYDGSIYNITWPNLGCNMGGNKLDSIHGRFADSVINRGKATRCITVPIAIGGTSYAQWTPASNLLFTRLRAAILRVRATCGVEPTAIIWGEGETDNSLGTSTASITASIFAIVDGIRAAPISYAGPFYVGVYTLLSGGLNSNIANGINNSTDLVSGGSRNIILGFNADSEATVPTYRLTDNTHFNDSGALLAGTRWSEILFP